MNLWPHSRGWRAALIGSGLLALGAGSLLGYWILEGKRRLRTELEALRASGAPEFPEQIVFQPRIEGADADAWWSKIAEASASPSASALAECASRIAAGESDWEIEQALLAALSDPRRVGSLSECELAVLRQRVEGDGPALEIALMVDGIGAYDWKARFGEPSMALEELMASPSIGGYLGSIELLCARAVRSAVDGRLADARQDLMLARRAADTMSEAASCVTHLARSLGWQQWISQGLLPLLHLSPADTDWSEHDALLASIDLPAEFERACICERAMGNGLYREVREASGLEEKLLPPSWLGALTTRTFLARDQAMYLSLMRRTIETAVERESADPWDALEDEMDATIERRTGIVDGILWAMTLPRLPQAARYGLGMQTRIRLVRAAIRARREGADSAIVWLAQYRDPFDGMALRTRLDSDGILNLWSVGEDGMDDPPLAEREKHARLDDIVVQIRVP